MVHTIFEEEVTALEEDLIRSVFVGKEADNSRSVEGNPAPGRDLTAVSTSER